MHYYTHIYRQLFSFIRRLSFLLLLGCSCSLSAQVVLNTQTQRFNEDDLLVNITTGNFTNMAAMQFTINWDPSALEFTGFSVDSTALQITDANINPNLAALGELPFIWVNSNLTPISLPDGSSIIVLHFKVLSGVSTEIYFDDSPTPIEFLNFDGEQLTFTSTTNDVAFNGHILEGRVFADAQMDCEIQEDEKGLSNWLVEISNGQSSRFVRTDATGHFRMYLSPDTYTIRPILPDNNYWSLCQSEETITLDNEDPSLSLVSFGAAPIVECPALKVDISTAFLRRCFENIYFVNYCNQGTAAAEDGSIVLNLPSELSIESSPLPYTDLGSGNYQFDIGTVPFNECSGFALSLKLDCESTELGQTHCVEANIFPQTLCDTGSQLWSGASLDIKSRCLGDSVRFEIENIGEGNMEVPQEFVVIEDMIMQRAIAPPIQLASGHTTSFSLPANGSTYRMEIDQVPFHPTHQKVSAAIEGCGVNAQGTVSQGFINMFEADDESLFTDVDCHENIGAFDPNDKTGYPIGYGERHFIDQNQKLTYHIRFQNTGTDTAFNIVVLDTLTEHLEVASLQMLSASHDYTLTVLKENILKFAFNDILLVDSVKNEPLSHGFIRFEIDQKLDVPLGTSIKNSAAIYFDFNEPVITNVTEHTLGKDYIEVDFSTSIIDFPLFKMEVQPNPFNTSTTVTIADQEMKAGSFFLYDLQGRLIKQQTFTGNQFQLNRKDLPDGMYLFKVVSAGQLMGQGKLTAH